MYFGNWLLLSWVVVEYFVYKWCKLVFFVIVFCFWYLWKNVFGDVGRFFFRCCCFFKLSFFLLVWCIGVWCFVFFVKFIILVFFGLWLGVFSCFFGKVVRFLKLFVLVMLIVVYCLFNFLVDFNCIKRLCFDFFKYMIGLGLFFIWLIFEWFW